MRSDRVRSVLYLPASNARAIEKARTLDCDVAVLDLEDGRRLAAQLVVGADGVRSAVRQHAFEGAAPVVTDWIALRGHLPGPPVTTATEWWGRGALFGVTPGPRGAAWFAAVRGDHGEHALAALDRGAQARQRLADGGGKEARRLRVPGEGADHIPRRLVEVPEVQMEARTHQIGERRVAHRQRLPCRH